MHWSEEHQAYLDFGLHTNNVRLQRPRPKGPGERPEKVRVVDGEPRKQYVNQFGYISEEESSH